MARTAISFINYATLTFVLYLALLLASPNGGSATGAIVLALAVIGANRVLTGLLGLTRAKARALTTSVRKAVR